MSSAPPPSEPDRRISRIRLSSRWSYPKGDGRMFTFAEGPMPRSRYGFRPCATACSPPTRVASAVPTAVDLVVLPLAAGGSLLGKALRHSGVVAFQVHAGGDSIFLHPLAPPALPGFHATMGALTPVGRPRGRSDHQQVSLLTSLTLPAILSPTTLRWRRGIS